MSDKPSMDTGLASILASIRETVGQLEDGQPVARDTGLDSPAESGKHAPATKSGLGAYSTQSSPTIESFLAELVRPYLASWLDAHLPEIVQKLVQQEVERMLNPGSEDLGER